MEVVDTIGAGDAFGGGFLARWSELGLGRDDLDDGGAIGEAVAFAIRIAASPANAQAPIRHGLPSWARAEAHRDAVTIRTA